MHQLLGRIPSNVQFLFAVSLIYFCYGRSSFVQERIVSTVYLNEEGLEEKFVYTFFILFFQCLCSAVASKLVILLFRLPGNTAPPTSYIVVSITFIMAQFFSFHSLLFVSYPTQVLAKSCKPIPVMIMGILVLKKRYTLAKYFFIVLMCCGIILFNYSPNKMGSESTSLWGYFLLVLSLLLDGITGPLQEKLVKEYSPTSNQLMFFSNVWASTFLFFILMSSGEFSEALQFCSRHSSIYPDLLWFGLCNAIGQHAVYFLVRNFGALVLSMATTTRKLFTILWSVVWFAHPVSSVQWFGVVLVFISLSLDIYYKKSTILPPKSDPASPELLLPTNIPKQDK